jgi:hypothetical protein
MKERIKRFLEVVGKTLLYTLVFSTIVIWFPLMLLYQLGYESCCYISRGEDVWGNKITYMGQNSSD